MCLEACRSLKLSQSLLTLILDLLAREGQGPLPTLPGGPGPERCWPVERTRTPRIPRILRGIRAWGPSWAIFGDLEPSSAARWPPGHPHEAPRAPQRACVGPSGRFLGVCKALMKPGNPSYFASFSCFGAALSHLQLSSTMLSHLKPHDGFQEALKKPQGPPQGLVLGPPDASWGPARPS